MHRYILVHGYGRQWYTIDTKDFQSTRQTDSEKRRGQSRVQTTNGTGTPTTSFAVVEDEGANTRRVGPYSALAWSEVIAHVCEVSAEHNQVQRSAFLCVGALISLSAPHYVSERSTYPCFPRAGLHFHYPAAVPLWTALRPHPDILAVLRQSFCQLCPE